MKEAARQLKGPVVQDRVGLPAVGYPAEAGSVRILEPLGSIAAHSMFAVEPPEQIGYYSPAERPCHCSRWILRSVRRKSSSPRYSDPRTLSGSPVIAGLPSRLRVVVLHAQEALLKSYPVVWLHPNTF